MVIQTQWGVLLHSRRRQEVLHSLIQPLTASQVAVRAKLSLDCAKGALRTLARVNLARCLNELARSSRVYGLTRAGVRWQSRVREFLSWPTVRYEEPPADWQLYGWVCFRHRWAVLRAMSEPSIAPLIRKRARSHDAAIRISVNNVRDVLRQFRKRNVAQVRSVGSRRVHELTDIGQTLRQLLLRAEGVAA
ncbi:MAG: hypothetical protein SF069_11710 [Phycisphaerae bacterium]|nr:hypothetical protein [Phycisphaerae bacterium]